MRIHEMLWGALLCWNLFVFLLYAWDKQKAIKHKYRISEKYLLWSSILLGGIGAFLAGQVCHHKTKKWYFWLAWFLGVSIDAGIVYKFWRM